MEYLSEFRSLFTDAPLVSAVPPKVSCLAGYRVALTCSVLSVPKPDVQWFFNRRQLKMDAKHTMEERGDNYTLTVADVRQQDLGEYTCSAVNKIGEAQATVLLTGTPFGLEIKSSSRGLYKHTYNLTWTMKSFVTIEETEISYRRKVRKVGHLQASLSFFCESQQESPCLLLEEIFAIQRLDGCIDSYHKRGNV